jgi:hypothetical protein
MKDYSKIRLYDLNKLCHKRDPEALKEWKRRWIAEWPSMDGQIKVKKDG